MDTVNSILFWGCFGILIYIYAGYILLMQILGRFFSASQTQDETYIPSVSFLFAARNERSSLPAKMDSLHALEYPQDRIQVLIASDASTDGTNEFLAGQKNIEFVALNDHVGKNAALNILLPQATGEILFFTDANTLLHPKCLRTVVRHFSDPRVGVVAGELTFTHDEDWNAVGQGAGLYWRYENRIKKLESRLGSLLVGGGSLLATRKGLIQALDPQIANDVEIPIRLGAQKYHILYEPECLGFEKAHTQPGEELGRTSRIVARGLRGFFVLLPVMLKSPFRLWQFLSHKFLRWLTLPFVVGMMVGAWGLRSVFFPCMVFDLGIVGILSALIGLIALPFAPRSRWARPFTLMAHMTIMHTAALVGILKAIFGKTPATWTIPESTRK